MTILLWILGVWITLIAVLYWRFTIPILWFLCWLLPAGSNHNWLLGIIAYAGAYVLYRLTKAEEKGWS